MGYFKVKRINEKPYIVSWKVCETIEEFNALQAHEKIDVFLDPQLNFSFGVCLQDLVNGIIVNRDANAVQEIEELWSANVINKKKADLINKMAIKHAEIGAAERRAEDTTILVGEFNALSVEYQALKAG